jgi:hypothetical protein
MTIYGWLFVLLIIAAIILIALIAKAKMGRRTAPPGLEDVDVSDRSSTRGT